MPISVDSTIERGRVRSGSFTSLPTYVISVQPSYAPNAAPIAPPDSAIHPPAGPHRGIPEASPDTESGTSIDTTPPAIHTRIVGREACSCRAMALGTMKIADAMIVPTLIIVASSRPSWRFRSAIRASAGESVVLAQNVAQPVVRQRRHPEVVRAGH